MGNTVSAGPFLQKESSGSSWMFYPIKENMEGAGILPSEMLINIFAGHQEYQLNPPFPIS